ncbi:hypothetical protein [Convivina intestini]|uniref:hypothetical protein n=1 Tax=Convivina intestini TaxID=1505726 RepID=UPI0020102D75|nr:hypothetical protein [Convivina intestini]CAH1850265.1 hypothetical protein R078131_00055 [Convivina intestini]
MKRVSNSFINIFLAILILVSIIGSVQLLPEIFNQTTKLFVYFFDILMIIIAVTLLSKKTQQLIVRLFSWFNEHISMKSFWLTAFGLIILWQMSSVFLISGTCFWDWQVIVERAMGNKDALPNYFSVFPNNLFLLKIDNAIWHFLGHTDEKCFILALNLINTLVIDLGTFLVWKVIKRQSLSVSNNISYIFLLMIYTLTPWVVIPYSDTWAFLFCALILYFSTYFGTFDSLWGYVIYASLLALIFNLAYFIKPTVFIILIAGSLILLLKLCTDKFWRKKYLKQLFMFGIIFCLTFCFIFVGFKTYLYQHNGIEKINTNMSMPLTHFMAMGMKGNGGFDFDDNAKHQAMGDWKQINDDSIHLIKKRYREFNGFAGYQKFLFNKQILNTSDGTLGWGHEGGFLHVFESDDNLKNHSIQRKMYLNNGNASTDKGDYRFIQQIFWIMILISILGSLKDASWFSQFLKYSAVGFFTFLLLFEGGRSRYLIQFLPILLVLSNLGIKVLFKDKSLN